MKRVYQTIHTDIETGTIGNCLQACLASLLEVPLESLPFFYRMDLYKPHLKEKHNLSVYRIEGYPPRDGNYYIVGYDVKGIKEIGHCVIWRNGRIVHDPKRNRKHRLLKAHSYYPLISRDVIYDWMLTPVVGDASSDDQPY